MASPSRRPMLQIANVCGTSSLYLARMDTSAPSKGPPGSRNASSMGTRHISLMPLWLRKSALAFSGKSSTATVGVSWVFRFPNSLLVGFHPLWNFAAVNRSGCSSTYPFHRICTRYIRSYLHLNPSIADGGSRATTGAGGPRIAGATMLETRWEREMSQESSNVPPDAAGTQLPQLAFRPLTPLLMNDLGAVLRGNFGAGCWCMFPRLTDAQMRELPGSGPLSPRRRGAMTALAGSRPPGLLAFEGDEPVGWVAVAPRGELARVDRSRATPRVDNADVWVIQCARRLAAGGLLWP